MSFNDYRKQVDPHTPGTPETFIQWKGTDVCLDFHCTCGHHMHFDTEFLYFVQCNKCNKRYAMSWRVAAIEIPSEHIQECSKSSSIYTNNDKACTVLGSWD